MSKVKLGSFVLVGALILFIWNAISWTIIPWHGNTLNTIPDEAVSFEEIDGAAGAGVYHYPGLPKSGASEEIVEIERKLRKGQRITLMVYQTEPASLLEPGKYVKSFILNILMAALVVWIIASMRGNPQQALRLCLATGILIALVSDLGQMVWYQFPLDYTLVSGADKIISFGLLGVFFRTVKLDFSKWKIRRG